MLIARMQAWMDVYQIEQIDHGHHVFRAYWKNALLRQYEQFSRFYAINHQDGNGFQLACCS